MCVEGKMKSKVEVEVECALGIVTAMDQDLKEMDARWAPSRRGSNLQRLFDQVRKRRETAEECLRQALKELEL